MRFTKYQYEKAIESLTEAMEQLEPDGRHCACCGDSGHQAFECGHNPLVAMAICNAIAKDAREAHDKMHENEDDEDINVSAAKYHEVLHYMAGHDMRMGEQVGPAKVVLPPVSKEAADNLL